jgi:hypothetical protein
MVCSNGRLLVPQLGTAPDPSPVCLPAHVSRVPCPQPRHLLPPVLLVLVLSLVLVPSLFLSLSLSLSLVLVLVLIVLSVLPLSLPPRLCLATALRMMRANNAVRRALFVCIIYRPAVNECARYALEIH